MAIYSTIYDSHGVDKTTIRQRFGARVRELRTAMGISQEAFADKCGFARSYMSRVERGSANPSIDALEVLAVGLGVQVKDLFTEAPVKPKKRQAVVTLVPYAADGSHFGPHLKHSGAFIVGEKEDECRFEDFDQALEHLRRMGQAKWRRPNKTTGKLGSVWAVRWDALL